MTGFFFRLLATAAGLWTAAELVPGISVVDTSTFFFAAILLGFVNAIIRPIIIVLTLPISILTLGLFLMVINAGMLGLVAWLMDDFNLSGFLPALMGSFIISIINWLTSKFVGTESELQFMSPNNKNKFNR